MSDPSSSWNYFQHGSLKRTGVRKSRSELENVETISNAGCNEVEAGNFEDGKTSLLFVVLFYVRVLQHVDEHVSCICTLCECLA